MSHQARYVYALGVVFLLVAVGHAALQMASSGPLLEAVLDFVLIGLPAVLLLYVAHWLARTGVDPARYPRIAHWCLAGVGVMFVFLVLRAVHPGIAVDWTFGTRAIALSLGLVAGLSIGIHEAQTLIREQRIARQNQELKRTKRALEERNEKLVRTRATLEQTVEEAEASNERLEQFAYAASHDLQEPLRTISQYLRLIDDRYVDELDDEAAEFVDFARAGADRMQTLVEDLLEYSRVGAQRDAMGPVDLDTVIANVQTDLHVRIEESDCLITSEDFPRVEGDAGQLRQLLQNLLSNAIEYCGEESPRIHLSAEESDGMYVVSVADEGIGIDPDEQEHVFEIFQRLHTPDEHSGSGIGLALCERIVEHHGGEIWVESEPDVGSTVSFTVPALEEQAATPAASTHD